MSSCSYSAVVSSGFITVDEEMEDRDELLLEASEDFWHLPEDPGFVLFRLFWDSAESKDFLFRKEVFNFKEFLSPLLLLKGERLTVVSSGPGYEEKEDELEDVEEQLFFSEEGEDSSFLVFWVNCC